LSKVLVLAFVVQWLAPAMAVTKTSLPDFTLRPDSNVVTRFFESRLTDEARVRQQFNQMPMNFTLNQGQTDARVKFTARGRGYSLFLTPTEAVFSLRRAHSLGSTALRMRLLQANDKPVVSGLDQLPMVSNYYLGDDPSQFRESVPHFAKVKYAQVYPGIDLVYYGKDKELEYDFLVAPGADPNVIQMKFVGANKIRLADNGDLVIQTKGGELRQHKPILYQTVNGVRQEVAGHFIVEQNRVRFAVGAYDPTKELVIDPTLTYSTYFGGFEGDEKAYGVAVPPTSVCMGACDAYVTGEVSSLTFPDTMVPVRTATNKDVFVARFNPAGTMATVLTFIGGSGNEHGRGIKVDASGNIYVVGLMGSNYSPGGATGFRTTDPAANNDDGFVAKLNAAGALLNFTYLGGSSYDQVNAIVLDGANVCVTGQTFSSNFPTQSAYDSIHNGLYDVFVTKLAGDLGAASGALMYSTFIGGTNNDIANAIDVYLGIIYVAGSTQSSNFPATPNGFDRFIAGTAPVDAIVARVDPTAGMSGLLYATFLGGNGREYAYGIAVNQTSGQFYVTGRSHAAGANLVGYSKNSLTAGFPVTLATAIQGTQAGYGDVFLTRFNVAGSNLLYSTLLGGSEADTAYGIEVRGTTAYIVGETDSSNGGNPFPTTGDRFQDDQPGTDAFVARIDTSLASAAGLVFSTYFGGGDIDYWDSTDSARALALSGVQAYVVGFTNSYSTASGGSFIVKPAVPYQEDKVGGLGYFDCFVTRMTP
jgi:hypothetical protein